MAVCDLTHFEFSFDNEIVEGYQFGQMSISIFERFKAKVWLVRLSAAYYGCVHPWRKPLKDVLAPLKHAYRLGLETGDLEFSMLSFYFYSVSILEISPLSDLDAELSDFLERMDFFNSKLSSLPIGKPLRQFVHNLMGRSAEGGDTRTVGDQIMDKDDAGDVAVKTQKMIFWTRFYEMIFCYLFGDYEKAEALSKHCHALVDYPFASIDVAMLLFFETLTLSTQLNLKGKQGRMSLIKQRLERIQYWARHSPYNFLGKQFLLEAELAAVEGDHGSAFAKYVCAISLSKEGGSILLEALANERAGKYFNGLGQKSEAKTYINEAIRTYERWGAMAKASHLQSEVKFVGFS